MHSQNTTVSDDISFEVADHDLSFSQSSINSDSPRYRKVPALDQVYRSSLDPKTKRKLSLCLGCEKPISSNELLRLISHTRTCEKTEPDLRRKVDLESQSVYNVDSEIERRHILLTKMIVANNSSLKFAESKELLEFSQALDPNYQPTTRQKVSAIYVPRLSAEAKQDFMKGISNEDLSLTVEFDHWKDMCGKSILGVVISRVRGPRYLCDLRDVTLDGHSTEEIVKSLKSVLESENIPLAAINSMVSDSAASCKAARRELCKDSDYQHIIQHSCVAHLVNRIGWHFSQSQQDTMDWIKIVTRFASDSRVKGLIRKAKIKQVSKPTATRWYSTVNTMTNILAAKSVIVEEAAFLQDCQLSALILEESSWSRVRNLLDVYEPMAKLIGQAEKDNGNLGDAFKAILEWGQQVMTGNWENPITLAAVRSFLTYVSPQKVGPVEWQVMLAAYMTDRRNKMDYLRDKAINEVLTYILELTIRDDTGAARAERSLIPEFNAFCAFKNDYQMGSPSVGPLEWWSKRADSGQLQQIALRLARLRSSSAKVERTFSALRYVQGSWRLNLSLDTMGALARLRIANDQGREDLLANFLGKLTLESSDDEGAGEDPIMIDDEFGYDEQQQRLDLLGSDQLQRLYKIFTSYIDFSRVINVRRLNERQGTFSREARIKRMVRESELDRDRIDFIAMDPPAELAPMQPGSSGRADSGHSAADHDNWGLDDPGQTDSGRTDSRENDCPIIIDLTDRTGADNLDVNSISEPARADTVETEFSGADSGGLILEELRPAL